jgi:hypothetical protein
VTRRRSALVVVWLLPSLVFVAITARVYQRAHLDPPPRLGADTRAALVGAARAILVDRDPPPSTDPIAAAPADDAVVAVSWWAGGARRGRALGRGPSLAAATIAAARALIAQPAVAARGPADRATGRLQLDVIVARAGLGDGGAWLAWATVPAISAELVAALALVPGQDGVGATFADGTEAVLLPGEVVDDNLVKREHPVGLVPDIAVGFDPELARRVLARGQPSAPVAWFRFRTDAFVEADGPPPALDRGLPPGPALTRANLRAAALAGAGYLVAHLAPSGRYAYTHDLATGARSDPDTGDYSIPRHAGVTYFLAQTYRLTHAPWLRAPIERAVGHLEHLVAGGGCAGTNALGAFACVRDATEVKASLGSTALTIVTLVEYERATGDARYRDLAIRLGRWLRAMQRPDGSFAHYYDVATGARDEDTVAPYFSGEAALALARLHTVTGDAIYADAAARALDWLVGWYDFFLGGFFFGEEHWTCIAAEALDPAIANPAYRAFCRAYGQFLRSQQLGPGAVEDGGDLAGAYSAAPFLVPANTPTGSRTEAMISTWEMSHRHGEDDPALDAQIRASLGYLLRQQIAPDRDFAAAGVDVDGAVPASPVDRTVRIDYVQHVGSALVRAAELGDLVEPTHD